MKTKYALITGASAGLGAEFAKQLAAQGHNLVITARRKDRLQKLKSELQKTCDVNIEVITADLSKISDAKKLVSEIHHKNIKIGYLVNNAGFGSYGDFTDYNYPELEQMIHVNINALVYLTLEYLPQMKKNNAGSILFVSSVGGFMGVPVLSVYAATKAFVLNLGMAIGEELKGSKVHIGVLCPGPTATEFFEVAKYGKGVRKSKGLSDPVEVVRQAVRAMKTGKRLIIPGLKGKVQVFSTRFFGRKIFTKVTGHVIRKMK